MKTELQTAHLSRVGGRKRNEDAFAYWESDTAGCWVVSDGAGGHGSGDLASSIVVETIIERFRSFPSVSSDSLACLLESAQTAVLEAKSDGGADMHATCVVLLIDRETEKAVWGHVGDSRLYLFRDGRLLYQTRDHSLVQNMIDAGYGTTDMIRTHPNRNLLTSAIGNSGDLEATISDQMLALQSADTFLLCSDGWWEYVEEAEMERSLSQSDGNLAVWLEAMGGVVARDAGTSNDNYTAVGVRVLEAGPTGLDDDVTVILLPKDGRQTLED